jgi:hypothetical protein
MPCPANDFGLALNLQRLSLSCSGFGPLAPRRAPNAPREDERVRDTTSSKANNLASCCCAEQSRSSDRNKGRWRTIEEAELAPLRWIHWLALGLLEAFRCGKLVAKLTGGAQARR